MTWQETVSSFRTLSGRKSEMRRHYLPNHVQSTMGQSVRARECAKLRELSRSILLILELSPQFLLHFLIRELHPQRGSIAHLQSNHYYFIWGDFLVKNPYTLSPFEVISQNQKQTSWKKPFRQRNFSPIISRYFAAIVRFFNPLLQTVNILPQFRPSCLAS